jgi:hypothetical protein
MAKKFGAKKYKTKEFSFLCLPILNYCIVVVGVRYMPLYSNIYLRFLSTILKAKREQVDVGGLLAVHGARVNGLRQVLVDAVRGLVVHRRVALFQRPFELLRHFILWTFIGKVNAHALVTSSHLVLDKDKIPLWM